jgi:hypothetical protein
VLLTAPGIAHSVLPSYLLMVAVFAVTLNLTLQARRPPEEERSFEKEWIEGALKASGLNKKFISLSTFHQNNNF